MKTLSFAIVIIFLLSSCSKVMYIPNSLNVPLFNEKKEFKANISINDYQVAYAVTNHIGLMANGYVRSSSFSDGSVSSSNLNYSSTRNLLEGGIGYFKPISEGFVYETYFGGGIGNLTYNGLEYGGTSGVDYKYSANFNRLFIQPSIGFTNDIIDVSFSARIVRLAFNNIKTENYTPQMLIDEQINDLDKTNFFFIEPALTFRIGYKWGKFQTQIAYSNKMNAEPLNYQKFSFNLGLHIDISPRFKVAKQNN
jgi:hypothetical protein